MIRVLFVCHGNICRSTMAQSVFQYLTDQAGLSEQFYIDSAATKSGRDRKPAPLRNAAKLRQVGIPCIPHRARQMRREEYDQFDYIIGMDSWNIRNINRILGNGDPDGKVSKTAGFYGPERAGHCGPVVYGEF